MGKVSADVEPCCPKIEPLRWGGEDPLVDWEAFRQRDDPADLSYSVARYDE